MARVRNLRFEGILRFISRCQKEIKRCESSGAYLAGCLLIGASVEYVLAAMMRAFPDDVYRQGRKLRENWSLKSMIELAKKVGWLDQSAFEAAERIRTTRNLIHPNWFANSKPTRFTRHLLDARQSDYAEFIQSVRDYVI